MPRQFDLNNYIDTQERINTFWSENPDGAIVTKLMSPPDDFTTCRYEAAVYRHKDDIRPSATGYAYEVAPTHETAQTSAATRRTASASHSPCAP
jgi:hypothetical protein